jgi:hypothetical protein
VQRAQHVKQDEPNKPTLKRKLAAARQIVEIENIDKDPEQSQKVEAECTDGVSKAV